MRASWTSEVEVARQERKIKLGKCHVILCPCRSAWEVDLNTNVPIEI